MTQRKAWGLVLAAVSYVLPNPFFGVENFYFFSECVSGGLCLWLNGFAPPYTQ